MTKNKEQRTRNQEQKSLTPEKGIMNIALFSPTLDVTNGWGSVTFEYCSRLSNHCDFTLFLPRGYVLPRKVIFRVDCCLSPFVPEFGNKHSPAPFSKPENFPEGFDLFHSLVSFPYAILAEKVSNAHKKPYVITAHGSYAVRPLFRSPEDEYLKQAYAKAAIVLTPSQFTADCLKKYVSPEINTRVVLNGVNYEKFQSPFAGEKERETYGKGPVILDVGELKPRKGQDILIKAIRSVVKHYPDLRVVLIGADGWDGYLQKLSQKLRVSENVHFLGKVTEEELIAHYQLCDLFVHVPRRIKNKFEGFGLVYLEAGACGKPVIGSKSGGVPDAVKDNQTGILVSENNWRATAKAILRVLRDKSLTQRLGEGGREYACSLTWESYTEKMKTIYSEILGLYKRWDC